MGIGELVVEGDNKGSRTQDNCQANVADLQREGTVEAIVETRNYRAGDQ